MKLALFGIDPDSLPARSNWTYYSLTSQQYLPDDFDAYLIAETDFSHFYLSQDWPLTKPVIILQPTVGPVRSVLDSQAQTNWHQLLASLEARPPDYLLVQTRAWRKRIRHQAIFYLESYGRKVIIHTNQQDISFDGCLKDLRTQLPAFFIQPHRSFLVNQTKVETLGSDYLRLSNGVVLPIARGRKQQLTPDMF